MEVDYIIVGLGLAGLAFSRELEKNKKTYIVFEDGSQQSSQVAGGMYNPIILKRFTPVWDASKQLEIALPFYSELEALLNNKYDYKIDVCRLMTSIEEQNNWFAASDNPALTDYLIPKIDKSKFKGIDSPFGYGRVIKTGRIDTNTLLRDYKKRLELMQQIKYSSFNYNAILFTEEYLEYKSIKAKKILFCEGFGMRKNPFFRELPMNEVKGELLTIYAPELDIDFVLKSSVFIMPLENHKFKVGATFDWEDKTSLPSEKGKKELLQKLDAILKVPYEVVNHVAGIRPTVKDRRPLVGKHSEKPQLAILNGLGTRGVMIAPTIANELYNHLENDAELRKEIDINRFN